ncbi:hypothetical protein JKP88DRAFT_289512 [Tribonema minus]|uniref:Uncharacterized protein n=1 Tax=Tribonema minus TaxID=303371 RepID=A0A836CGH6_9STRA|nr:hypothetical protein JKP88DRAFT_289512 [Tribonema minus]
MLNSAEYTYRGGAAGLAPGTSFASSGQDSGGDANTSAGGSYAAAASTPLGTGNNLICALSSEDRDVQLYPNPQECLLTLADSIASVKGIRAVSAEIPHTSFTLVKPRLYFSELHDGVWIPFFAGASSGNYDVNSFTTVLNASTLNAVCLADSFATPRNRYDISYSEDWGCMCIASDRACDFTIQFRRNNVRVSSASISNTAAGQFVVVVISDRQADPLSVGAGVQFTAGVKNAPVGCVVSKVDGNALSLSVIPSVKTATPTPTLAEGGGVGPNYLALARGGLISAFGTDVDGTAIPVATTAALAPFSGVAGFDNLGDALGFGTLMDRTIDALGTNAIAGLQSPFDDATGAVLITTHQPHFCTRGDVVRISNSGTFLDDVHEVTSAVDDTHLTIVPLTQPFVDTMPALVVWTGVDAAGQPVDSPVCFDLVESAAVSGMGDGEFTLEMSLKEKTDFDVASFVGKRVAFAATSLQWAYAEASFAAITTTPGSAFPDRAILTVKYPTWLVSTTSTTFERVGNALIPTFSQDDEYFPCRIVSPGRFDFSRRRRFVYVAMTVEGAQVGNVLHPALEGKRMFARVPLAAGQSVVNFVNRDWLDGAVEFATPLTRLKDISFALYDASGAIYNGQNAEWSITLEFALSA